MKDLELKYRELKVAVEDLLNELRIGPTELIEMSKGYSPSYLGKSSNNVVQLSKVVASKLVSCGIGAVEDNEIHDEGNTQWITVR